MQRRQQAAPWQYLSRAGLSLQYQITDNRLAGSRHGDAPVLERERLLRDHVERGTGEQQAEKLNPQLATQFATFEVYVTGAANPPQPDFGDFDATELLVQALYQVLWDGVGGARAKVLHESWPSQTGSAGSQTQRGQQWKGIVEFQMPVSEYPLSFVPPGTSLQLNIAPVNPGTTDTTTLTLYPGSTD